MSMSRAEKLAKLGAIASAIRLHELKLFEIVLKGTEEEGELMGELGKAADVHMGTLKQLILRAEGAEFSERDDGST